ncbi:MAG: hypothetical protein Q4A54_09660 [Parabacteroides sp.]|nr:hypothetical protein [Parabacteroides sp.]
MIELLINSLPVDLPADFSFQMDYENEFFTKASEYSLDIELPLLGSPNNQKIFGNIHRSTTPKDNVNYEAVAYVKGRCVAHGSAIILGISDTIVRIQLVGNTSYINYFTSETYIDELDLGYAETGQFSDISNTEFLNTSYIPQSDFAKGFGSVDDTDMVLFWSYYKDPKEISDAHNIFAQRHPNSPFPTFGNNNTARFEMMRLSNYACQPYLLKVIERIVSVMGFTIRRNDLNHTWLRNLYICNCKGSKWTDWNNSYASDDGSITYKAILRLPMSKALPHWTVTTFFDEVEKLCACVFVFNTYNKTVDIIQLDKFYDETASVFVVDDDSVVDQYEFEFSDSGEDKDLASGNICFDKDYTDKYLKMDAEVRDSIGTHNHYADYDSLVADYESLSVSNRQKILFIDDSTGREYICFVDEAGGNKMIEVNIFCDFIRNAESSTDVQLKIVPANTRLYGIGWFFETNHGSPSAAFDLHVPFVEGDSTNNPEYTTAQDIIENSYSNADKGESAECMEVMLSTGQWYETVQYSTLKLSFPVPFTDYNMPGSAKGKLPEMSLSLKDVCEQSLGHMYRNIPVYDTSKTFIFRFLSSVVPDPRQPFLFHNQRYVCRKLSADFEQNTKQMIFEGEFYRIG